MRHVKRRIAMATIIMVAVASFFLLSTPNHKDPTAPITNGAVVDAVGNPMKLEISAASFGNSWPQSGLNSNAVVFPSRNVTVGNLLALEVTVKNVGGGSAVLLHAPTVSSSIGYIASECDNFRYPVVVGAGESVTFLWKVSALVSGVVVLSVST